MRLEIRMNRNIYRFPCFLLCKADRFVAQIDAIPSEPGKIPQPAACVIAGEDKPLPVAVRRINQMRDLDSREDAFASRLRLHCSNRRSGISVKLALVDRDFEWTP